MSSHLGGRQR